MHKLVSKREAAEILGCDVSTVQRLMAIAGPDGLRPAETIDGAERVAFYRFRRTDVEKLAARRLKAAS